MINNGVGNTSFYSQDKEPSEHLNRRRIFGMAIEETVVIDVYFGKAKSVPAVISLIHLRNNTNDVRTTHHCIKLKKINQEWFEHNHFVNLTESMTDTFISRPMV